MQQTTKYQFKLIEGSDDFSPQPLNDNVEKVEQALQALETSVAQDLETLETSVAEDLAEVETSLGSISDNVTAVTAALGSHGENTRMIWGSYKGTGQYGEEHPNSITCDFIPRIVLIQGHGTTTASNPTTGILLRGATYGGDTGGEGGRVTMTWTDTGVSWYADVDQYVQMNSRYGTYYYLVLGYDE